MEAAQHINHANISGLVATLVDMLMLHCGQGLLLISPAVDAQKGWLLSFLEKIQGIAFRLCPNARIVPSPPWNQCTDVPELVSFSACMMSFVC